ncbi:MAG: GNAT family N-acetyltransferase [Fidelibacterota bacterium]
MSRVHVKVAESDEEVQHALAIRREVFIEEQSVPEEIEMDSHDGAASHALAWLDGKPVGTARWRKTEKGIKLERFAVPAAMRGKGIGKAILMFILNRVTNGDQIYLHAQTSVISFYEKYGFACVEKPFKEAGISHRRMIYRSPARVKASGK